MEGVMEVVGGEQTADLVSRRLTGATAFLSPTHSARQQPPAADQQTRTAGEYLAWIIVFLPYVLDGTA